MPHENPYLQALVQPDVAPMPLISKPRTDVPAAVFAPSMPSFSPAGPITPPQSKIPDFAKPSADEKYFKQLKRF